MLPALHPSKYLIFTPNYGHYTSKFPCSSPNNLLFTPNILSGYVPVSAAPSDCRGEELCCARKACCANIVGGVDSNEWFCAGVRKTVLAQYIYWNNTNPEPNSHYGSRVPKGFGTKATCSTWEYNLVTIIEIYPLTQPLMYKMGSSIFAAKSQLKAASTTWSSLTIIPSTKRTNREKWFCWSQQYCMCLPLSNFIHRGKILSIHSVFQVFASEYHNLTSIIASIWISHMPQIDMSIRVSGMPLLWGTSSSDLLSTWQNRGFPCTQLG